MSEQKKLNRPINALALSLSLLRNRSSLLSELVVGFDRLSLLLIRGKNYREIGQRTEAKSIVVVSVHLSCWNRLSELQWYRLLSESVVGIVLVMVLLVRVSAGAGAGPGVKVGVRATSAGVKVGVGASVGVVSVALSLLLLLMI